MSESAAHPQFFNSPNAEPVKTSGSAKTGRTTKGGQEEIKWEIVAEMAGITLANIVAGRLKVHDIPVRAWQEGAGQAFGLTVGLLGTGYVAVPEEYAEEATAILAENVEIDPDEWKEEFAQTDYEELLDEN